MNYELIYSLSIIIFLLKTLIERLECEFLKKSLGFDLLSHTITICFFIVCLANPDISWPENYIRIIFLVTIILVWFFFGVKTMWNWRILRRSQRDSATGSVRRGQ